MIPPFHFCKLISPPILSHGNKTLFGWLTLTIGDKKTAMLLSSAANIVSFVILCCFFYGRSLRLKDRRKHAIVMAMVIGADILLVLFLVFARQALGKVNSEMPWPLMIHIPIAISTVVFYGFAVRVGLKLLRGDKTALPAMRLIDRFLVPLRILTFLTSVLVQLAG